LNCDGNFDGGIILSECTGEASYSPRPTANPTPSPTNQPTMKPIVSGPTFKPTPHPTPMPSTFAPTSPPSVHANDNYLVVNYFMEDACTDSDPIRVIHRLNTCIASTGGGLDYSIQYTDFALTSDHTFVVTYTEYLNTDCSSSGMIFSYEYDLLYERCLGSVSVSSTSESSYFGTNGALYT
jgi:hypothetical protein